MRIFIDADASPVVKESIEIAKDYDLEIIIVKNYAHQLSDDYATVVSVDVFKESADLYIINNIEESDIVVTQDYGLAALCLGKNAVVINQNGMEFTDNNINTLLDQRFYNRKLRSMGGKHSNPKKRKKSDDKKFITTLINVIEKNKKNLWLLYC